MQLGILGFPKVGKTTLFNILTASHQSTDKFAASGQTNVGVAQVPDPRLAKLRDLFSPRKYTPATVEYVDIPGIQKGEGAESLDLGKLRTVDALVHVVRAFDDPELPHSAGQRRSGTRPARDRARAASSPTTTWWSAVSSASGSRPSAASSPTRNVSGPCSPTSCCRRSKPRGRFARWSSTAEDERRLRGFQLLSAKPLLVVLNVGEGELAGADPGRAGWQRRANTEAVVVSAPIEEEIAGLAAEEQREFLAELGLDEPSVDRVIRASYRLLGLLSFFTVGEDEVRAWTLRRGTHAREAAGTIHSDIERGFIRAEVVAWEELVRLGSLAACRAAGSLRLEGKEYEVQDGEVIHFRFAV